MYEIRDVPIDLIDPNPHRDLTTYPWMEHKIRQLTGSIREVGFWASVIARPQAKRFELAFGHHRLETARRLKLKTIPLILTPLSDLQMLQYMGRENGEDYASEFLVMLNTWEGAVKFLDNSKASSGSRTRARENEQPLAIARLLGWTDLDARRNETRLSATATACAAAHALITGGHLARQDLRGLNVYQCREITTRAQDRIDALARVGKREGHAVKDTKRAQAVVGKAAKYTAEEARKQDIAGKHLRDRVDINAMRNAGKEDRPVRVPLFQVFGDALSNQIARMINTDSAAERIEKIHEVLPNIEMDEDFAVIRRLHHELDELGHRTVRAKKRTTPNKVVPLKPVEYEGKTR